MNSKLSIAVLLPRCIALSICIVVVVSISLQVQMLSNQFICSSLPAREKNVGLWWPDGRLYDVSTVHIKVVSPSFT